MKPSFAERRDEAERVVVGTIARLSGGADATSERVATFDVVQALKGTKPTTIQAAVDDRVSVGDTALLLGRRGEMTTEWEVVPVDETSLAYFARLPATTQPWPDRLRYAARFLEHENAAIADDVYREFGRAPFDAVAAVADSFDFARVRGWIVDPAVPDERKGFFGLLLGLATAEPDRSENVALLRKLATAPAGEFRAGFDGILGGLLWAEGTAGLERIDECFLRNPAAAEGDVRHAQTALRFYQQYGTQIPPDRMRQSVARLLDRPGTAAGAIQDFTRRREWDFVDRAAALFLASLGDDPSLDRAVVGYLILCPEPTGAAALRRLRATAPRRLEDAERFLALVGIRSGS